MYVCYVSSMYVAYAMQAMYTCIGIYVYMIVYMYVYYICM